jgi:hypothetical protein
MAAILRRIADFVGYTDMLPIGQALGAWHASTVMEDDYFMSSEAEKKNQPAN